MKFMGKFLIGMGLFLFGMLDWWIPASCIIGGIAAINLANEFKL